jgi:hypothetical protein
MSRIPCQLRVAAAGILLVACVRAREPDAVTAAGYVPRDTEVVSALATHTDPGLAEGVGSLRVHVIRDTPYVFGVREDARVFLARDGRTVVPPDPTPAGQWPGVQLDSLGWATLGPTRAGAYDLTARQLAFRGNRWPVVVRAGFIDTVQVRLLLENCDLDC